MNLIWVTYASESLTVPKVTRFADEQKREIEEEQKSLRNEKETEKPYTALYSSLKRPM